MADYGNVPEEDTQAVWEAARIAGRVADRLDPGLSAEWREIAFEGVLDAILGDWVENGTNTLDEEDEEDLASLIRLAVDVALAQPDERRDGTFRIVSKNVMRDWIENWNADGDDFDDEFE